MRNLAWALALLAACGSDNSDNGNGGKKDAAVTPVDGPPPIDAPPLIACTPVSGTTVKVRQIGRIGNTAALLATSPPNDGRLFVVDRQGLIRIFENEVLKTAPFLDVSNVAGFEAGGEQGLLGLAFHPNYGNNRTFYVFYTTSNANVVARYTQSLSDPNKADPTGEVILSVPDFASNHNGGMIEFGPKDGYLYIGTGDGGGGGDPQNTAQNVNNLLGKILRIDVNTEANGKKYGIPAGNPYAAGGGAPEVFILGLRNPWRWSFDRETGDMYIGDVGQGDIPNGAAGIEEVTVLKAGEQAGKNLGWDIVEGTSCFPGTINNCNQTGMVAPQFTQTGNNNWHSVIGGQVYRGSCFPDLVGYYFFTDYTARPLMRGKLEANGTLTTTTLPMPAMWPTSPTSLHADARGELFLTNESGYVYQIEAGP
jgi:glucose/arabinose dehydrogenase